MYADVRPEWPARMSLIARHYPRPIDVVTPYQEGSDNEEEIVRNLEGLTHGIPEYARIGDMPRLYQRHTVGVSNRIRWLLIHIVRDVPCYHYHHAE